MARVRQEIRVYGVVQGVGFRPYVYNLALSKGLSGLVGNDDQGVFIEVEGEIVILEQFQCDLIEYLPPLARIDKLDVVPIPVRNESGFTIVTSQHHGKGMTLISPDVGLCDDCLKELRDSTNRRYRYPFINCTNCGPRFTIIENMPYDRPLTTMAFFDLCPICQHEYDDPNNRRFHAQPNACPDCGPHLIWKSNNGEAVEEEALSMARQCIMSGGIAAIKGIGGFHLACDATNFDAVARLRIQKKRPSKPFAIMVADIESAQQLTHITSQEAHWLTSQQRPIVLLQKRLDEHIIASNIAPDTIWLGLFLPYTPVHHLLMENMPPLVMTSANISGEPIISEDEQLELKLGHIIDGYLTNNRPIYIHCDDSVVRLLGEEVVPLRRSRGYAPYPISLPSTVTTAPSLAVGADVKNCFCLAHGQKAFMSQHIGDMETLATSEAFERTLNHLSKIFTIQPEYVVVDTHPAYFTTKLGEKLSDDWQVPLIRVQHHHAHVASVMAECNISEPVIGICWDGTGYGYDGTIWGGEVLIADYSSYERVAHLRYTPLLGGDASIKYPYRTALSQLWSYGIPWTDDLGSVNHATKQQRRIFERQLAIQLNTIKTSSMGRLFDVVASLLGLCHDSYYEAQAPMALESIAIETGDMVYDFIIDTSEHPLKIDAHRVLNAIISDLREHVPIAVIAGRFHLSLAHLIRTLARHFSQTRGIQHVALTGGVFQNHLLMKIVQSMLFQDGFNVLCHRLIPPNDAGIALGQIMIGHYTIINNITSNIGVNHVSRNPR